MRISCIENGTDYSVIERNTITDVKNLMKLEQVEKEVNTFYTFNRRSFE